MTLTVDFTPQEESWLAAEARQRGLLPADVIRRLVDERMPSLERTQARSEPPAPEIDEKNRAAIAVLQAWMEEDATDDPEEIRQAEADLEELKRNLNANRAATGERLVFP